MVKQFEFAEKELTLCRKKNRVVIMLWLCSRFMPNLAFQKRPVLATHISETKSTEATTAFNAKTKKHLS